MQNAPAKRTPESRHRLADSPIPVALKEMVRRFQAHWISA